MSPCSPNPRFSPSHPRAATLGLGQMPPWGQHIPRRDRGHPQPNRALKTQPKRPVRFGARFPSTSVVPSRRCQSRCPPRGVHLGYPPGDRRGDPTAVGNLCPHLFSSIPRAASTGRTEGGSEPTRVPAHAAPAGRGLGGDEGHPKVPVSLWGCPRVTAECPLGCGGQLCPPGCPRGA